MTNILKNLKVIPQQFRFGIFAGTMTGITSNLFFSLWLIVHYSTRQTNRPFYAEDFFLDTLFLQIQSIGVLIVVAILLTLLSIRIDSRAKLSLWDVTLNTLITPNFLIFTNSIWILAVEAPIMFMIMVILNAI